MKWSSLILFLAAITHAEGESKPDKSALWRGGTLEIYEENDKVRQSDSNYTQGLRVTYTTDDFETPKWIEKIPFVDTKGFTSNFSTFIGQNIYTPGDIEIPDLTVNDQPYAGWLYGGFAVNRKNKYQLDSIEFSFGVVGPLSFAKETQSEWHRFIGVEQPEGWRHQLHNEPTFNIGYLRKWKVNDFRLSKFEIQFLPHIGWAGGNVFTYANFGGTARIGLNLPKDFGRGIIGAPAAAPVKSDKNWGVHLFGGLDGRAVVRNIFFDGNTFTDSHSVEKENFVGDLKFGAAMSWWRLSLSLTHVIRTREFEGQQKHHEFGSLNLAYRF